MNIQRWPAFQYIKVSFCHYFLVLVTFWFSSIDKEISSSSKLPFICKWPVFAKNHKIWWALMEKFFTAGRSEWRLWKTGQTGLLEYKYREIFHLYSIWVLFVFCWLELNAKKLLREIFWISSNSNWTNKENKYYLTCVSSFSLTILTLNKFELRFALEYFPCRNI